MRADRHAGHARARRAELRDTTRRARLSLAITPMIDVVFQLLIYFLLATSFVSGERQLRAEMPADGAAPAAQDPFALEVETLVVGVVREGARTRYRLSSGLAQPAERAHWRRRCATRCSRPSSPAGSSRPTTPCASRPRPMLHGRMWSMRSTR